MCSYPFAVLLAAFAAPPVSAELSAKEIVKNCYYKDAGKDQRSELVAILRNKDGSEKRYEFARLWKDYTGESDLVDKVIIFTLKPLVNKDIAFMRWGYTIESNKKAEQWVYLPETRLTRRLAKRDPKNGDWGLNDDELRIRNMDEDDHTYLGVHTYEKREFYVVESRPKLDPIYSKRVAWYHKTDNWDTCVEGRLDYYDKQGKLVKKQFTKWDKIDDAWIWRSVVVKNAQTKSTVIYKMKDIEVNVGLDDSVFSKRTLERGYRP